MNADVGVLVALKQVQSARTKWVAWTTIHTVLEATIVSRITLDHFLGWNPARPLPLRVDCSSALEFQSLLADSDAITASSRRRFNKVKETLLRVDHDSARLIAGKSHFLRPELRIDVVLVGLNCIAALGSFFLLRLFRIGLGIA